MRMQVRTLALLSGLRIQCCRELWYTSCRRGSDLVFLWLWHRPGAAAVIQPIAWKLAYAMGAALKRQKLNKNNNKNLTPETRG